LFKNDLAGIGCRVYLSNMPKEREVVGLGNHRKLGDLANLVIADKVKPANVQDPSWAPLIRYL